MDSKEETELILNQKMHNIMQEMEGFARILELNTIKLAGNAYMGCIKIIRRYRKRTFKVKLSSYPDLLKDLAFCSDCKHRLRCIVAQEMNNKCTYESIDVS